MTHLSMRRKQCKVFPPLSFAPIPAYQIDNRRPDPTNPSGFGIRVSGSVRTSGFCVARDTQISTRANKHYDSLHDCGQIRSCRQLTVAPCVSLELPPSSIRQSGSPRIGTLLFNVLQLAYSSDNKRALSQPYIFWDGQVSEIPSQVEVLIQPSILHQAFIFSKYAGHLFFRVTFNVYRKFSTSLYWFSHPRELVCYVSIVHYLGRRMCTCLLSVHHLFACFEDEHSRRKTVIISQTLANSWSDMHISAAHSTVGFLIA